MKFQILAAVSALSLLAGCNANDDLAEGGGIAAVRSACPTVGVAASTGDITLFNPPQSRESTAIDVAAFLTNVRSTCDDAGAEIVTTITFDVQARRANTAEARDLILPYYVAVVRGGNAITSKKIGQVALHFDAGQLRTQSSASATTNVSRAAATLPDDVKDKLNKKRKAGESDAATDPLSQPEVRQAVLRATFEALVGFQLTDEQLKYNATR